MNSKLTRFSDHLSNFGFAIIGHRGAAGLAPENTLSSFKAACDQGCSFLELDVHQLKCVDNENELLVIHDNTLERTTNASGRVSGLTETKLANIKTEDGKPLPYLKDVLALIKQRARIEKRTIGLNIELKGNQTGKLTAKYIKKESKIPMLISSFKHEELFEFREIDKSTPVAPLFHKWDKDCIEIASSLSALAINCSRKIITPKRVEKIKQHNFKVFVYTVNSTREAERLCEMGVDGIFSDRPDRMKEWLT